MAMASEAAGGHGYSGQWQEPDAVLAGMGVGAAEATEAAARIQAVQRGKLARRERAGPARLEVRTRAAAPAYAR